MIHPFWQRKPVWLRLMLALPLIPLYYLVPAAVAAAEMVKESHAALQEDLEALIKTPRSAQ